MDNNTTVAGFMLIITGLVFVNVALTFILCRAHGRLAGQIHHLKVMMTSYINLRLDSKVVKTARGGEGGGHGGGRGFYDRDYDPGNGGGGGGGYDPKQSGGSGGPSK